MPKENTGECEGCGSTHRDRMARAGASAIEFPGEDHTPYLKNCPRCGAIKCSMCDMGDDVNCITCDNGCGDDD